MKKCSKCNEIKPYTEFHKNKGNKDGYKGQCKVCCKSYQKKYYAENEEAIKQQQAKWRSENDRKDYYNNYNEEHKFKRRSFMRKYNKSHYANNKEMYYLKDVKRRSYTFHVKFTPYQRLILLEKADWKCNCCGVTVNNNKENTPTKAHIDHIVPISKGGNSELDNLQVLCRTCNLSKADKLIKTGEKK